MARLYNGFDALGIGKALRDTQNNTYQMQMNALDEISKFGDKMDDYLKENRERKDAEKQKISALQYLANVGMEPEKAQAIVESIGAKEAAQTALGEEIAERKRVNDNADKEYFLGLQNADEIEREKRAMDTWLKQNKITYEQAVKSAQFGQLMQNLGLTKSKDWGNSRQGVEQYNADVQAIKDFVKDSPEYADVLKVISMQDDNGGNAGYFDEDILEKIRGDENKGIKGVIGDTAASEEFLKDLMAHDKLNYIKENPKFRDAITQMLQNADLKKLSPYITLEDLNKGEVTAPQRREAIAKDKAERDYNSAVSELKKATGKEKGKFPKMTRDQLKRAYKDKNLKWRIIAGVNSGAYKMEDIK